MTGRERLRAMLDGRPTDRLPWTTLVDRHTLNALPEPLRGCSGLEFYRHVGCDILQLGGWGLPRELSQPLPRFPGVEVITTTDEHGFHLQERRSAHGTLTMRFSPTWHPVEHPIQTIADVRLLIRHWENAEYDEVDDRPVFEEIEQAVGDDGITVFFLRESPIPHLLEYECGVENFYFLLHDYPDEMDALIRVMQAQELREYEIVQRNPCDVIIMCENTSTMYISPEIYARYNMPSQQAFVEAMHRVGKTAILHQCGHLFDLLPLIKETGTDGIHTLTPPPLGNTPWETALDVLGDDLIIFGCLVPEVWVQCPVDEMGSALDRLITPRLRESRFCLAPMADGIAVPLERFQAVQAWVEHTASLPI
jgi:uroporphyrinogen-III decarboxylase